MQETFKSPLIVILISSYAIKSTISSFNILINLKSLKMNRSKRYFLTVFICFTFTHVGESINQELRMISSFDDNGDASKTVLEFVNEHGLHLEVHKVTTEDGYILSLWRINRGNELHGPPLILQHGVLDDAYTFLLSGGRTCPAFYFAKKGYDVWIPNSRGQTYSLEHTKGYKWYLPFSAFWNFSFHEMALYDFPTIVEYVKKTTRYSKVSYAGHSQGTTTYFIKASMDPEFINENINAFIGMGPAIYVNPRDSKAANLFANEIPLFDWMHSVNMNYFWVLPEWILSLTEPFCRKFPQLYYGLVPFIGGQTEKMNFDIRRWPSLCTKMPGGTSTKNLLHWLQIIRAGGRFQMFDYGAKKNMEVYQRETPKEYDLTGLKRVKVPSLIVSGSRDALVTEESVRKLVKMLKTGEKNQVLEVITMEDYAHMDFIWGKDSIKGLYPNIDRFIKRVLKVEI